MPLYSFGLIGYPLQHSLSPVLHMAALNHLGLSGEYVCYPLQDLGSGDVTLIDLLKRMREGIIQGLNVTIPHKNAVIPYLDELTIVAHNIGAVNTIYFKGGRLIGDNTDAPGFMKDLMNQDWYPPQNHGISEPIHHNALVLGAGGSACAIVYALLTGGWDVTIAARRLEQAIALCTSFREISNFGGDPFTNLHPVPLNPPLFDPQAPPELIINTTPLGMTPEINSNPWPAGYSLPISAAVYDLVYNPPETEFMRMATSTGLPNVNGLGMLIEQAVLAFKIWTDLDVPGKVLHRAVTNHILATNKPLE